MDYDRWTTNSVLTQDLASLRPSMPGVRSILPQSSRNRFEFPGWFIIDAEAAMNQTTDVLELTKIFRVSRQTLEIAATHHKKFGRLT
jgi:hypothetical protein